MEKMSPGNHNLPKRSIRQIVIYLTICICSSIIAGFLFTLLLEWCVSGDFDFFRNWIYDKGAGQNYGFSVLILTLLFAMLFCLFADLRWSVLIEGFALLVLAEAEVLKYDVRKELLHYKELILHSILETAVHSVKIYVPFRIVIGFLFLIFIFIVAFLLQKQLYKLILSLNVQERVMYVALGLVIAIVMIPFAVNSFYHSTVDGRTLLDVIDSGRKEDQQVIYRFLYRNSSNQAREAEAYKMLLWMLEQEGLDQKKQLYQKEPLEQKEQPNVIVVMAESLWDLSKLENETLKFSKPPLGNLEKYAEEFGKGSIYTNIQGGGTISTEAQFLLGVNTKYTAGAATYGYLSATQELVVPSVVEYFKKLHYRTVALHPYYGSFYSRDQVYKKLGFDDMYFADDMNHKERSDNFISDMSFAKEAIRCYEEKGSQPLFLFGVTIGAHGAGLEYDAPEEKHCQYTVIPELAYDLDEEEMNQLLHYVNCLHETGEAVDYLVNYFSQKDDPTIILVFGDHIPNLPKKVIEYSHMEENEAYEVPVYMWNNFNKNKMLEENVDATYLSTVMLDYLGMPECNMTRINHLLMKHYRFDNPVGTADVDGIIKTELTPYDEELLKNMQLLDNAMLDGGVICKDIWGTEQ